MLSSLDALLLGIIEGLTEFLPISSTGHLILLGEFLHIEQTEALKAFDVVIQAGAIAAVIFYFREKLKNLLIGVLKKEKPSLALLSQIIVAFLPAAIIGFLFGSKIKLYLFGPIPVIAALFLGGIAMIFVEKNLKAQKKESDFKLKDALFIGCAQCFALWPGMSRSMCTILGARARGLSAKDAAEFSFLLALPTLLAAALYETLKNYHELSSLGATNILIGTVSSFVVALLVIKWFLNYLTKHSLQAFGIYRIVLAIISYFILV